MCETYTCIYFRIDVKRKKLSHEKEDYIFQNSFYSMSRATESSKIWPEHESNSRQKVHLLRHHDYSLHTTPSLRQGDKEQSMGNQFLMPQCGEILSLSSAWCCLHDLSASFLHANVTSLVEKSPSG